MNSQQIAAAIAAFAEDLKNSYDMTDRKNSVQFLANKIGVEDANKIAEIFGLVNSYYKNYEIEEIKIAETPCGRIAY